MLSDSDKRKRENDAGLVNELYERTINSRGITHHRNYKAAAEWFNKRWEDSWQLYVKQEERKAR